MADSPSSPDTAGYGPGPTAHPGMPRWVKVFGIVAILVAAVFIALHIAGLSAHGHG